jgi:hypothetical protein
MAKTRTPSVWVLSRVVSDGDGEAYKQNVSVYAGSAREAVALVGAEFARLARITCKAKPRTATARPGASRKSGSAIPR